MRRIGGLNGLVDLHRAMGGERAEVSGEDGGLEPSDADLPENLYVSRDRKARKGKEVTLVEGFDRELHHGLARSVAKSLKAHCGVGGGWKDGVVLLQGDHRQRVAKWLADEGYTVKHKGG